MRHRANFKNITRVTWLLAVLAGFSACLGTPSKPSRTFLLSEIESLDKASAITPSEMLLKKSVRVGVGPFKIPEYLNRPQIVSRTPGNELLVNEFHRWAEPLSESMPRVMAQNMSRLLEPGLVFAFPWRSSLRPDYQVIVDVVRFDGSLGGDVSLIGHWNLYDGSQKGLQESKKFSFTVTSREDGFEALVDAHNRLVYLLSLEVASAIGAHSAPSS